MSAQEEKQAAGTEETKEAKSSAAAEGGTKSWGMVAVCIVGMLAALWVFLLGLEMLGDAFKCLGGRGAGSMFTAIQNPIAGLMTGILATVLVQSSSTSTSIVVGLVGADQISVHTGIPIIMGANIGTSVTNTIVSMGSVGDRYALQRAFSGATIHDMFNFLTVLTLLPLEIIIGAIQGEGGPLYWITKAITQGVIGGDKVGELFPSPTKEITSPVVKLFISNDKYVINALSLGEPTAMTPNVTNSALCSGRRLAAEPADDDMGDEMPTGADEGRASLSRRASAGVDCSKYYCISSELDKNFKSISSSAYKTKLTACGSHIVDPATPCNSGEKCYLDAGKYFTDYVTNKHIIKGGFLQGAGDIAGGIIALVFSLLFLSLGLLCLTKCLHYLFMGRAKHIIVKATGMNDYIAMLIGVGITIVVQSSSVTTSALTPFCGMGLIPLEKMMPLTLGANIGTTVTALIAALTKMTQGTVHIALCHLFFNIIGILIWFPVPFMRRIPLGAARLLGLYASFYRVVPLIYILVAFVLLPGVALGVSSLFDASIAGGVILLLVLLAAFGGFEFWWVWMGGCYKVISKEDREAGWEECVKQQKEILDEQGGTQEADSTAV